MNKGLGSGGNGNGNWTEELNEEEKAYFNTWINSNYSKDEFMTWMDEKKHSERGDLFYGRSWDAHVKSCRKTGRDPYD